MTKDALELLLSHDTFWSSVSTIVLTIGICGEYLLLVYEMSKKFGKKEVLTLCFAVVVIAGLVGEYYFPKRIADTASKLELFADQRVTEAEDRAKDASNSATEASNKATAAEKDAEGATRKASKANERASENERQAAALKRDAAEQVKRNLNTQALLETEKERRLDLERSLAPRSLSFKQYTDGSTNIDGMRKNRFMGLEVTIEYIPDAEAQKAAFNLGFLVEQAGWKVVSFGSSSRPMLDGIFVNSFLARFSILSPESQKMEVSQEARVELWRILRENDWVASYNSASSSELNPSASAPGALKILVGFKPNPFFKSAKDKADEEERERRDGVRRGPDHRTMCKEVMPSQAGAERVYLGCHGPANSPE